MEQSFIGDHNKLLTAEQIEALKETTFWCVVCKQDKPVPQFKIVSMSEKKGICKECATPKPLGGELIY